MTARVRFVHLAQLSARLAIEKLNPTLRLCRSRVGGGGREKALVLRSWAATPFLWTLLAQPDDGEDGLMISQD